MAKIINMNPQSQKDLEFEKFFKGLSKDQQALFEEFNIKSCEDMAAFIAALGIDLDKMLDYCEKHQDDDSPNLPIEQLLMDEDHPLFHDSILSKKDDEDDDNEAYEWFDDDEYLPERVFIGDKTTEYHIRIKLKNAPLPIWRELKVPSNITLEAFSNIILEAMGWDNMHFHQFKKGNILFMDTQSLEEEDDYMIFDDYQRQDSNDWSLEQVLMEKGDRMEYEYDFGDGWKHEIWVKGIREYNLDEKPGISIVKGKGACPPEDCGGVYGYGDLLRIHAKKRKTKEEKERLEWYWMDNFFDPEYYDVEEYQETLNDLWNRLICK